MAAGYGQNIVHTIEEFNKRPEFQITFLAYELNRYYINKYKNIHFVAICPSLDKRHPIKTLKNFLLLLYYILFFKYDLLMILGDAILQTKLAVKCTRCKKIFQFWNSTLIEESTKPSNTGKYARYILKNVNYIYLNWWGVRERFLQLYPQYEKKCKNTPLGIDDSGFFQDTIIPQSDYVRNLLSEIPKDYLYCFWPRSFNTSNRHDMVIQALSELKQEKPELFEKFLMHLWIGNMEMGAIKENIKQLISSGNLEENVKIIDHPFVPIYDVYSLEQRSDFFVQISENDVLSTFIIDMILRKKPFVLNNLRAYQFLNEKYGLDIPLISKDIASIKQALKVQLMREDFTSAEVFDKRYNICKDNFMKSKVKPAYYNELYSIAAE